MFDNKWNILDDTNKNNDINEAILKNRNINDIEDFLTSNLDKTYDPFTINEMDKTVNRIISAIYGMEKIIIYGDYDVDGITSTSMLVKFIKEFTENIDFFIPHRFDLGYGLSKEAVLEVLELKPNLIITVDCGVQSYDEVEMFNSNKVDIIITDHHKSNNPLPNAYSILCNTRYDNTYKNPYLSSSGLTYKLIEALNIRMNLFKDLSDYLQLATLGLVADIVPLVDENRILVKHGLLLLNNTKLEGIKALFDITGIKLNEAITPYHLGYIVCPRINAVGRMAHAKHAVEMFLENKQTKAIELAEYFDKLNKQRQQEQQVIYDEVVKKLDDDHLLEDDVIVIGNENWNHAIIGIVASKICDIYNKPTIILDIIDNIAKGSARSIDGFNIIDAIEYNSDYLIKFGGHKKAAGLTLEVDNLDVFRKEINAYFKKDNIFKAKEINIDLLLKPDQINYKNIIDLDKLQPFGECNKRPTFVLKNIIFRNIYKIGKDKNHLKANSFVDCVTFNCDKISDLIVENQEYDIVFYPNINKWRDKETIQLIVYDYKLSGLDDIKLISIILALKEINGYNNDIIQYIKSLFINRGMMNYSNSINDEFDIYIKREDIIGVYKYIKTNKNLFLASNNLGIDNYKIYLSMHILKQLNLIKFSLEGITNFKNIILNNIKNELVNSKIFRIFNKENNE